MSARSTYTRPGDQVPTGVLGRIRSTFRKHSGQAMVETAMILPILLLLIGAVADVGRAFYYKIAVTNAAREAAHWAILVDSKGRAPTDGQILNDVAAPSQETYGLSLSLAPVCASGAAQTEPCPGGNYIRYSTPPLSPTAALVQPPALPAAQRLQPNSSFRFIYPDLDGTCCTQGGSAYGRNAMLPQYHYDPNKIIASSRIIEAPPPDQGGLASVMRQLGGGLYPQEADASGPQPLPAAPGGGTTCYTFAYNNPSGLSDHDVDLAPGGGPTLLWTEVPSVAVTGSGTPANYLITTVDSAPGLSGFVQGPWTPANPSDNTEAKLTFAGAGTVTASGPMKISASTPPGTYILRVTTATFNNPGDITPCSEIGQTATFKVLVHPDPCLTYSKSGPAPTPAPVPATCSIPVVTSVSPSTGPATGGGSVTINGMNFSAGSGSCKVSAVMFGGTAATGPFTCTDTQITNVVPPPGSVGSVDVTVTTAGGPTPGTSEVNSPADLYTYTYVCPASGPCVTKVAPASGTTLGGTAVTITGQNFDPTLSAVTFGGVPATTFSFVNSTTVKATSPGGSAGPVDVQVSTASGTSPTGPNDKFKYISPPPTPPPPGGSTVHSREITVTVIYYFTPVTPGLLFFAPNQAIYIVGSATLEGTY